MNLTSLPKRLGQKQTGGRADAWADRHICCAKAGFIEMRRVTGRCGAISGVWPGHVRVIPAGDLAANQSGGYRDTLGILEVDALGVAAVRRVNPAKTVKTGHCGRC